MVFKIGALKNFANFTGKHLCWRIVFIKLQAFRSNFFTEHFQRLLFAFYGTFVIKAAHAVHDIPELMRKKARQWKTQLYTSGSAKKFGFFSHIILPKLHLRKRIRIKLNRNRPKNSFFQNNNNKKKNISCNLFFEEIWYCESVHK